MFAQPDTEAVAAQFERITVTLESQFPEVTAMLHDARHDLLAFAAFHRLCLDSIVVVLVELRHRGLGEIAPLGGRRIRWSGATANFVGKDAHSKVHDEWQIGNTDQAAARG